MKTITWFYDIGEEGGLYRKKPVVVRAIKLKEEVQVETREGTLKGYPGDFIIEGIEGEIYPCDRKIFWKTYEEEK